MRLRQNFVVFGARSVLRGGRGLKEGLYPFQDIGMKGQRVILKLFVDILFLIKNDLVKFLDDLDTAIIDIENNLFCISYL